MDGKRLTIGSVRGIALRIDRSWILIALLVAWSFWDYFTTRHDYTVGVAVALAGVGAVLFFASVLVHELAHALEAQHRGVHVGGITLFLFGGVTETRFDVERPGDEFALTAVGPFSSFVLAAGFGLIAAYAGSSAVADVAGLLGWINGGLGAFNLLPGAPLDGGRILRSAVWKVSGDRERAVRVASRTGQVIGALIGAFGLYQVLAGGLFGGLWYAFIGWFLYSAAGSEIQQHELRRRLAGLTVADVAGEGLASVPADRDLALVADALRRGPDDAFTVTDEAGALIGVVGVDEVAAVDPAQRGSTRVDAVARPIGELPTVAHDREVVDVLGELRQERLLAITADGGVERVVSRERLLRALQRTRDLDGPPPRGRRRRRGHLPEDGVDAGREDRTPEREGRR